MPRFTHPLNVLISDATHQTLIDLSNTKGTSIAFVVRTALAAYLRMALYGQPTCANGTPCPMHAPPAPQPRPFPAAPQPQPVPTAPRLPLDKEPNS